jgi:hypothetical protein
MNVKKIFGFGVLAALTSLAFAGPASATTLETNGVKQTSAVSLSASLLSGTSTLLKDTAGSLLNTCTVSTATGKSSTTMTGTTVSGPVSTLAFTSCTHEKVIVDKAGTLSIEWIKGTTNGTLRSTGAEVTVPVTLFGSTPTVTCFTSNTDIGTLTGVGTGTAVADIRAVLNCGMFIPSAIWEGTYVITGGHSIGVVE